MTKMQTVVMSLGAVMLLAAGAVQAQSDLKIGFVNLQAIIQNAPQIPEINSQLRDEFASRDADLQAMQEDYTEKFETYERDAEVMAAAERTTLERELTQMRRDIERRGAELQEDLQIRQNELVQALQVDIVQKVQAWADLNDYDLIVTDAVFVSEAVDISAQVYEAIADSLGQPADSDDD